MATAPAYDPRSAPIAFAQLGDFAAVNVAQHALKVAGFSIGRAQAHAPRGLLLGAFDIQKWRNLSQQDRRELDGEMHGGRDGPVSVLISPVASEDVLAAFDRVRDIAFEQAGVAVHFTRRLSDGMIVDA